MSVSDFLKDLPTVNRENFTKINNDSSHRNSTSKKSTYVPTKDIPSDQVIVTEKTNILLRYLHQQWDKKAANGKKRGGEVQDEVAPKKPRLEAIPDTSNTAGSIRSHPPLPPTSISHAPPGSHAPIHGPLLHGPSTSSGHPHPPPPYSASVRNNLGNQL
jgi:DET1- and DDB1-associated protein 1